MVYTYIRLNHKREALTLDIKRAEIIARDLIGYHLKDYSFSFCEAKTFFGFCNNTKRIITLSRPLTELNLEADVIDTIIHEIAHGLTPGQKHNKIWREMARALGDDGARCYPSYIITPPALYTVFCVNGCFSIQKNRKRKGAHCRKCKGKVIYKRNKLK